ncbi:MAG TPA: MarR family transcriptional regulator [Candidatus Acidoferrum sp.]|nr:MarR family transcriptional regulator [Candidatus Acidoferrum sp.]
MQLQRDEYLELLHQVNYTAALFRRAFIAAYGSPEKELFEQAGGSTGKPRGYGKILATLSREDGITQSELAARLSIRPQSLTAALTKLEQGGYITRQRGLSDRREQLVLITPSGRRHSANIQDCRRKTAEEMFACLSDEERGQLSALLARVTESFENSRGGA